MSGVSRPSTAPSGGLSAELEVTKEKLQSHILLAICMCYNNIILYSPIRLYVVCTHHWVYI